MSTLLHKLESLKHRYEEIGTQLGDPGIIADRKRYKTLTKSYPDLEKIVVAAGEYKNVLANIDSAKDVLVNEKDEDFKLMAKEELEANEKRQEVGIRPHFAAQADRNTGCIRALDDEA